MGLGNGGHALHAATAAGTALKAARPPSECVRERVLVTDVDSVDLPLHDLFPVAAATAQSLSASAVY